MNYPTDLKYSKTHEWVKEDDGLTVVGISDFAQDSLGDIVFIGLPSVGDQRRLFQRTHQCVISVFRRHELRFPNMNGFIIVISSTLCLAAVGTNGSCGEGEGIFLRNER